MLDKTRIAVSGRDVKLSADAFSEEGRRSATSQVEAVNGVRLVNDNTSLIPEAKPFVWSIERDVVRVTLKRQRTAAGDQGQADRGRARRAQGHGNLRQNDIGAGRIVEIRQCRVAADRSGQQAQGRQDHAQ